MSKRTGLAAVALFIAITSGAAKADTPTANHIRNALAPSNKVHDSQVNKCVEKVFGQCVASRREQYWSWAAGLQLIEDPRAATLSGVSVGRIKLKYTCLHRSQYMRGNAVQSTSDNNNLRGEVSAEYQYVFGKLAITNVSKTGPGNCGLSYTTWLGAQSGRSL